LQEVDKSISYVITKTTNLNTENTDNTENTENTKDYKNSRKSEQKKLEESYSEIRIDWTSDQIRHDQLNIANDTEPQRQDSESNENIGT